MMVRLRINGIDVEARDGSTVVEAAPLAGADVPTLCYEKQTGALTTCMICVVKDVSNGRMFPACATSVREGMDLDTEGEDVRNARREILRLLLNEHVGDCEGPCSNICPAGLNIPRMLRYIAAGDDQAAARLAKRDLIFPATLGRLCTAPCEKACRRASYDTTLEIRRLHGECAEAHLGEMTGGAERAPATGKRVAIVGAGLAGLAAAWTCLEHGHTCRIFEKTEATCSALRALPTEKLPRAVLDAEIDSIRVFGAEFEYGCKVGLKISLEQLAGDFDAVIVACGISCASTGNVFEAKEDAMLVRAVGHGKAAGRRVDAFLRGLSGGPPEFNSQVGRLHAEEKDAYAVERLMDASLPSGIQSANRAEAARCLHCDCLKPVSCKLRRYAEQYGLGPKMKRTMTRLPVEPIRRASEVLFEPGKCIKCGICVELTRAAGVELGLTFEGRGLDSRLQTPFHENLAQGLGSAAAECVRACPTGALAFRNEEETS
jgi:ferredoxin